MKTVYFVRHGESEANADPSIFPAESVELTAKGREQAQFIAKRCARLDIDVLIASTAVRAQQTAAHISDAIHKPVETDALFRERQQPDEMLKLSRGTKEGLQMEEEWTATFFKDDARVGNGENFAALKSRVQQALAHLLERPEERFLVVSHGFFLHMLAAVIALGDDLTAAEFNRMGPTVWHDNTGLTRIEYRDQVFPRTDGRRRRDWMLRVWNDHAHLG